MLAGDGLLRWPGHEQRVQYRMSVGFDSVVSGIHIAPPEAEVLRRPSRHQDLYLHTPEGRRIALNVDPNGHVSPDGPLQRSLDGQDWWLDSTPWLPFETPDRVTLSMRRGPVQIFESHANNDAAEASYANWKALVENAEIRPPFGRPLQLTQTITKKASAI